MKRSLALCTLLIAALPLARAQTLVVTPGPNPASSAGQVFAGTVGLLFSVNAGYTVTITSLGFWDYNLDGVIGPNTVSIGIFNSGGSLLSQMDVTSVGVTGASGPAYMGGTYTPNNPALAPSGEFRAYTLNTPLVLPAGSYAIAGWGYNNSDDFINGGSGNDVANFNLLGGALTLTGSSYNLVAATLPDTTSAGSSIMSATFIASAIPEPATYAAIFGGLTLGLAALQRIRRRQAAA